MMPSHTLFLDSLKYHCHFSCSQCDFKMPTATTQAIAATTQQSRFHTETLDTSCEDVDLKSLTLTVGDEELLSEANLRLFSSVHYGLVGANGVGK